MPIRIAHIWLRSGSDIISTQSQASVLTGADWRSDFVPRTLGREVPGSSLSLVANSKTVLLNVKCKPLPCLLLLKKLKLVKL